MQTKILRGVVHGKAIELTEDTGLTEGQEVTVEIRPVIADVSARDTPPPWWLDHLDVDPTVALGKLIIKGTRLQAEALVALLQEGWSEEELLHQHPELTPADMAAVREYGKIPPGLRSSLGAWAEDAEELDKYLEWNHQQRKVRHRELEP